MGTQKQIDDLIIAIEEASDPGSVTNAMVAAVMDFLNEQCKSLESITEDERADREHEYETLTKRFDALLDDGGASEAIDTFNEIRDFLEGIRNEETLLALLDAIRTRLNANEQAIEELRATDNQLGQRLITALESTSAIGARLDGVSVLPVEGIGQSSIIGAQPKGVWYNEREQCFTGNFAAVGYESSDYNEPDGLMVKGREDRIYRIGTRLYRLTEGKLLDLYEEQLAAAEARIAELEARHPARGRNTHFRGRLDVQLLSDNPDLTFTSLDAQGVTHTNTLAVDEHGYFDMEFTAPEHPISYSATIKAAILRVVEFPWTSIVKDPGHLPIYRLSNFVTDTSNWDLSALTKMNYAFAYCPWSVIDVSALNTANVTDLSCCFMFCGNVLALDVKHWDTRNVKIFNNIFWCCANLVAVDVQTWDTGNATQMSGTFAYCSKLVKLDTSKWVFSNVTTMRGFIHMCAKLETWYVGDADFSNCTTFDGMFFGDYALKTITGTMRGIKASMQITESPLTSASVQIIIDGLADLNTEGITETRSLMLAKSVYNSLTEEQKNTCTSKGWTVGTK